MLTRMHAFLAPEDDASGGSAPVPEAAPAGGAEAPASGVESGSPPSNVTSAQFQALQQRFEESQTAQRQWEAWYRQTADAQAKAQAEFQEKMLGVFAPDLARERAAPKYVTVEQFEAMRQQMSGQATAAYTAGQIEFQLDKAKAQFPQLSTYFGNRLDAILKNEWYETGKPITQIAAEIQSGLIKTVEAEQAKLVQDKEAMARLIKGSGVKANGAAGPQTGIETGKRGRAHLAALFKSGR